MAWSDNDYRALAEAASAIGARPLDLMVVLASESGLDPTAVAHVNGEPYALGLNQITPPNAQGMGIYPEPWSSIPSMSVAEQMPLVVRSFKAAIAFLGGAGVEFQDAGHLYQANFAPATLKNGTDDDLVLYAAPSNAYAQNKQLDSTNRGSITVSDMREMLRKVAAKSWVQPHFQKMRDLGLVEPDAEPVIGLQGVAALPWTGILVTTGILGVLAGLFFWGRHRGVTLEHFKQRRFREIGARMKPSLPSRLALPRRLP